IGAIMATEVIKLITGVGRPLSGRVTTYDALSGGFRELAVEKSSEPVTGLIDYEVFCGVAPGPTTGAITPAELAKLTGVTLVDVRETWEAEIAALPGALLIPLGTLPEVVGGLDPSSEYVVYCHHGT